MTTGTARRDPFPFLDAEVDDEPASPPRRYAEGLQLWLAANAARLSAGRSAEYLTDAA